MAFRGAVEIAMIGDPSASEFTHLERAIGDSYVPSIIVAGHEPADDIALLNDRTAVEGKATAYVCRGYVCDVPATDPAVLREQLASIAGSDVSGL
jgi:uncharacterized protein YyaL (SSP411 family)